MHPFEDAPADSLIRQLKKVHGYRALYVLMGRINTYVPHKGAQGPYILRHTRCERVKESGH